jgi:hypothetical protein
MDHNARIAEAITDLESQDRPNIAATARKYQVARETLLKRFRGKTGIKEEANSYVQQQLT